MTIVVLISSLSSCRRTGSGILKSTYSPLSPLHFDREGTRVATSSFLYSINLLAEFIKNDPSLLPSRKQMKSSSPLPTNIPGPDFILSFLDFVPSMIICPNRPSLYPVQTFQSPWASIRVSTISPAGLICHRLTIDTGKPIIPCVFPDVVTKRFGYLSDERFLF